MLIVVRMMLYMFPIYIFYFFLALSAIYILTYKGSYPIVSIYSYLTYYTLLDI